MLKPDNFFDLEEIPFLGLFENVEYVWEALKKIQEYIKDNIEPNVSNLRKDGSVLSKTLVIHEGKTIDSGFILEHGNASKGKFIVKKDGAVLGGENSGHIIFLEHHTTGDGLITALQLLAVMQKEEKAVSELSKVMKIFPQVLINVDVKSKPDLKGIPEIGNVIGSIEKELGDKGRVLVRYSGTQPMCRVMVEGPTKEQTEKLAKKIALSLT